MMNTKTHCNAGMHEQSRFSGDRATEWSVMKLLCLAVLFYELDTDSLAPLCYYCCVLHWAAPSARLRYDMTIKDDCSDLTGTFVLSGDLEEV